MFNSVGWGELLLLLVVGLVVVGPERLPTYVTDGVRLLRRLRELSQAMTIDLRDQLGPDLGGLIPPKSAEIEGYRLTQKQLPFELSPKADEIGPQAVVEGDERPTREMSGPGLGFRN